MAIRKCFFDRNGKVVEMLNRDPGQVQAISDGKDSDVIFYKPPVCWMCSLIGEHASRILPGHVRQFESPARICSDDCKARPTPAKEMSELWVIHGGDEFHRKWSSIGDIEIVAHPLAFLFVSYGGGPDIFADKIAQVVEAKVKGRPERTKIPVFHYRDGIASCSNMEEFTELLNCFEHALQELENQCGDDPLEPFRKVALDSCSSEWPQKVGLRDGADDLYLLRVACKLADENPEKKYLVDGLLSWKSLSIAAKMGNSLRKYLNHEHRNLLIPLSCLAQLRRWMHDQKTSTAQETAISVKKQEIVEKWISNRRRAALDCGFTVQDWEAVKRWAIADVQKWDSMVK